jgi:3-oxoacyl-[acyl-carrier protein] reductase
MGIYRQLSPLPGQSAAKAATALNRYGSVDEVAALVAFVAGPEAASSPLRI